MTHGIAPEGLAAGRPVSQPATAETDIVQPFQLDRSNLRGRLVRLGPALDAVLTRHAYPPPVAQLLGETITLAVTLAAALKYEGIFTLQTKGDGPVSFTVADITSAGDIRGYASFDANKLAATLAADGAKATVPTLLGKGYLAFTVDQGAHTERYQGIVALDGPELDDCVRHYFRQSEQLATGIKVAVGTDPAGHWVGGSCMVQALPEEDAARTLDRKPSDLEDDWRRAMLLLGTCTDREMLDAGLPVNDLLYRLFHEERVRVYTRHAVQPGCRCSRDRVATVLRSVPRAELSDLRTATGDVAVTCEFCNTRYGFGDADLDLIYGA